jgi:hypothetical protein
MSMSNVMDFLEKWGRDARLRYAAGAELERALAGAPIDPFTRKALLAADRRHLEFLVGAQPNVCCMIAVPTGDEAFKEQAEKRAGEQQEIAA